MQRFIIFLAAFFSIFLIAGCAKETSQREVNIISPFAYEKFHEQDAIPFVKGKPNANRTIYVFSRPNCPYCNRFEDEVKKLNNIKVLNFIVVGGKDPTPSLDKWCKYQESVNKECDTKTLERNNALGQYLKVSGTPTIVFPNRMMVPGFMSAGDVERVLSGGHP